MTRIVKALITDERALDAITPTALRAYAVAQGWVRTESFGPHSDVYVQGDGVEAILPGTTAIGDYASVVASLISVFAKVEARHDMQVLRDLSEADRDVIRVRAPDADDDGSIDVDAGVNLVVHARELLLSAACSAWDPRPSYRAGKVKRAEDYMERVRLGQTEQGSFIVTLLSPVPPALEPDAQPTLWPMEEDEPYERLVTRRFAEGLLAARDAVEKSNRGASFEVFERAVLRGVSANLCSAAADLIEDGTGLDISITWARTRRTPEPRKKIEFTKSDGPVLREAARLFHEREPRPQQRLEGFIVKLGRPETTFDGQVTLKAFVDGRFASVQVDLPRQMYDEAIQAHKGNRLISISGTLERQGKRWRLREPDHLRVGFDDEADGDEGGGTSSP
jgi:hypothetical protein